MKANKAIVVKGASISVISRGKEDYISVSNMVRSFHQRATRNEKWLRNKNTIEFTGIGAQLNNPDFHSPKFEEFKRTMKIQQLFPR